MIVMKVGWSFDKKRCVVGKGMRISVEMLEHRSAKRRVEATQTGRTIYHIYSTIF